MPPSGVAVHCVPKEMRCGSGMTCWRRLRDWQQVGVWNRLHRALLGELGRAGRINWYRVVLDGSNVSAKTRGAEEIDQNPTDRGGPGSKHHLLADQNGVPLVVGLTPANVADAEVVPAMLDRIPRISTPRGGRRRRPRKLYADKAHDSHWARAICRIRRLAPRIAQRGFESSERLGCYRWVVERSFAWLHRFRCLIIRYERRADIHEGPLSLAVALVCWKFIGD